jgi:hypothetical protein
MQRRLVNFDEKRAFRGGRHPKCSESSAKMKQTGLRASITTRRGRFENGVVLINTYGGIRRVSWLAISYSFSSFLPSFLLSAGRRRGLGGTGLALAIST